MIEQAKLVGYNHNVPLCADLFKAKAPLRLNADDCFHSVAIFTTVTFNHNLYNVK